MASFGQEFFRLTFFLFTAISTATHVHGLSGDERCSQYVNNLQQFRACLIEPCKFRPLSDGMVGSDDARGFSGVAATESSLPPASAQPNTAIYRDRSFVNTQGGVLFRPNSQATVAAAAKPNQISSTSSSVTASNGGAQQPFECYEAMQPPANFYAGGIQEVYVALGATRLGDVDESHQKLRMPSWVMLAWRDERLTFNASRFPQPLTFRSDEVWTPRLLIDEARDVTVSEDGFSSTTFTNVIAYGSFNVQLKTIADDITCYFDGISFPYAQQNCTLSLMAWAPVKLIALPLVDCGQTLRRRSPAFQRELDDVEALRRMSSVLCLYGAPLESTSMDTFIDPKRDNVKSRWRSGHWKLATALIDGNCLNDSTTPHDAATMEDDCYAAPVMYIEEHGSRESYFSVVRFMFSMKRDATMDVLLWLVTPGIMSFFSVIVVYFACDPSERFGFGASVLITDVLMLIAVSEKVPNAVRVRFNTEFNMPLIVVYYFTLCLAVVIACFLSSVPDTISKAFKNSTSWWAKRIELSARVLNVVFCLLCLFAMSVAVILISSQWTT